MPENKENILRILFEFLFLSGFWVLPVNATLSSIIFTLVFTVFFPSFFSRFYRVFVGTYFLLYEESGRHFTLSISVIGKVFAVFLLRPRNILIFRILISVRCSKYSFYRLFELIISSF